MPAKQSGHQSKKVIQEEVIRVMIVTGHGTLQKALVDLISGQKDIEVCASVHDLCDADRLLNGVGATNILILDWPVSKHTGAGLLRELLVKHPRVRCLVISLYDDPFSVKKALDMGVNGYVTKCMAAEVVSTTIRALAAGQRYFSSDVLDTLPQSFLKEIFT